MIQKFDETGTFVGLVVIINNEDELMLLSMIRNLLEKIDYPTHIHVRSLAPSAQTNSVVDKFLEFWQDGVNDYVDILSYEDIPKKEDLTVSLNRSIEYLLNDQQIGYIGWFHPDMVGHAQWESTLVSSMVDHQGAGKISAYNSRDVPKPFTDSLYDGHEQCYLIRRGVLERVGLFDERFLGIGGYEDWDMNNRIMEEGFKVLINPLSIVRHLGMYTRCQKDQSFFAQMNRNYYYSKWGTYEERI